MNKIDFVVTWVNGNDKEWISKRNRYNLSTTNFYSGVMYRNWNLFKYWFRGIECYAPWVNKIFLVTDNQIPRWLNINHPKLTVINHDDIINNKYLPTFNSNSIEANFHKISDLSSQFVVFNDDTFIVNKVEPDYFFLNGYPRDLYSLFPIIPSSNKGTSYYQLNNYNILRKYFDWQDILKNKKIYSVNNGIYLLRTILNLINNDFVGFYEPHLPIPFLKKTYEVLWKIERDTLLQTTSHKFRNVEDTNIWLFRDWQLASGITIPFNTKKRSDFLSVNDDIHKINRSINDSTIVCLNDAEVECFDTRKEELISIFERKFPNKSMFELEGVKNEE